MQGAKGLARTYNLRSGRTWQNPSIGQQGVVQVNKKTITIVIMIALIAGSAAGAITVFLLADNDNDEENGLATVTVNVGTNEDTDVIACPQDARQCADGSYVGRVPPDCEFLPCPELPPVQQAENIKVYAPQPGADISSPVNISGEARVFEGTVNYRVRDNNGTVIGEGFTTATSPEMGQFGPYAAAAAFSQPRTEIGQVEVFNLSARDGSVENLVVIPVIFRSAG